MTRRREVTVLHYSALDCGFQAWIPSFQWHRRQKVCSEENAQDGKEVGTVTYRDRLKEQNAFSLRN